MEKSGGYDRSLSVGGIWRTLWKVNYWRSPDGTVEARTVGGVQKDTAQGRKPEESWEGWPLTNFGQSYFLPNTSPPTSEFGFRMKYREIFIAEVASLDFCTRLFPDILAFGALMLESFQIEEIRKDFFRIFTGALL